MTDLTEIVEAYLADLDLSYQDYVAKLLASYGPAEYDYFNQSTYHDFKHGLTKTPGKNNKVSRTSEGLYCHHIDEDKQILISTNEAILHFDIPYQYQLANRLVYCNLIEHALLHIKIAVEQQDNHARNQTLGIGGYVAYIRPNLIDWLLDGNVPSQHWQLNCYHAIEMSESDATDLIIGLDEYLVNHYPITEIELNDYL